MNGYGRQQILVIGFEQPSATGVFVERFHPLHQHVALQQRINPANNTRIGGIRSGNQLQQRQGPKIICREVTSLDAVGCEIGTKRLACGLGMQPEDDVSKRILVWKPNHLIVSKQRTHTDARSQTHI